MRRLSMKKYFWALLLCAALFVTACGAGASASDSKAKTEESADQSTVKEEKAEASKEAAAETAKVGKKAETAEDQKAETAKDAADEAAKNVTAEAAKEAAGDSSKEKSAEAPEASEDGASAKETVKKEKEKKEAEEKKASEEKKEEKEKDLPEQYMPDGFTPYGSYVLVYDSGYEVKTRYSAAGLTYYYESEEFQFRLNKDLPDVKREVAHILFNTAAPMDPGNTEGEKFPYEESYIIYISLDDGSYYEVAKGSLDLEGRVFVRDIFESFREKWEGAF
jgi:hypothetical protein